MLEKMGEGGRDIVFFTAKGNDMGEKKIQRQSKREEQDCSSRNLIKGVQQFRFGQVPSWLRKVSSHNREEDRFVSEGNLKKFGGLQ